MAVKTARLTKKRTHLSLSVEISLFGTCLVRVKGDQTSEVRGIKHRALFVLLATSLMGRRSRADLQTILWGETAYDSGHQNLRRALSDLRRSIGSDFDELFQTTNSDIQLHLENVRFIGNPDAGEFLEDLNVQGPKFVEWVQNVRQDPSHMRALYKGGSNVAKRSTRPCVTSLPLRVLEADPNLSVLADWVSEEANRSLSRSNLLNVISHLSGRAMAQSMTNIPHVRETLSVDYILTGTLRRSGDDLIADFDFIDANDGEILWTRQLKCGYSSFSDQLQDGLVNVVQSIGRSIAGSAIKYVRDRPISTIDDHQLIIAGVSLMHRSTIRDFIKSRELLVEASERLPDVAETHAWLGKWHVLSVFKGLTVDREHDTQKAIDCTARALDTDPENSFSLTIDGFAQNNLLKRFDVAEQRYNAALELNPNESLSWLLRGVLMAFQDEGRAAIRATETARRLSPIDPFGYYYDSLASSAYIAAEDFDQALKHADKSLATNDRHLSTLRTRTTALYFLGRQDEANVSAGNLARWHPDFSIEDYKRNHPSAANRAGKMVIEALEASGIN